ncbi:MAG: DUF1573 domain-containing protein [Phycisphaerae bacterium]|nr:DUF1573 domain-containing protein [Phycisphaerae bacterium]MBT6269277.1 DUF1573 domain-containing protein [Phycisphaerae bacterium]MBT6282539.1 DUF1573 domain-containing protein [Phycisphaerae bacterium]
MKYSRLSICLLSLCMLSCEQPNDNNAGAVDQALPPSGVAASGSDFVATTQVPTSNPTRGADISLEWDEREFGLIWDFETVTTTFPFTNTGSKTLVLSRLQAGCGCTTPRADKTILQPGESGTITVTFDPKGKANKQDKKVTIFSNSVKNPEKAFWIRSTVRTFVEIKNKFLNLNQMQLGVPSSVEFDFFPVDPDFKITSMVGTGKHGQFVSGEELIVPEGSPRRIRINVSPNMPWGAFHSQLQISGNGKTPEGKTINHAFTVFANGKTFGKLVADKHIISIGSIPKGGTYHSRITIKRPDGIPFRVLNTAVLGPNVSGINATTTSNVDGSYDVIVSGKLPISHSGPINAEVMVQTDVPGEEVLKFRIAGVVPK